MKCPSCSKFAANDTSSAPDVDITVQCEADSVELCGSVRIVLTSECCGDELKECTFDVSQDVTETVREALKHAALSALLSDSGPERDALLEAVAKYPLDSEALTSAFDDLDWACDEVAVNTITGKDKVLKNGTKKWVAYSPRYYRTEYGYEASCSLSAEIPLVVDGVTVRLPFQIELEISEYIPASSMDELV